jgi:hypothetical protein
MLPSSAIHVVQDSADQIRIVCPPNYFLGMIWILAAVILFAILKLVAPREWKVPLIIGSLCLLPALVVFSSYEVAVLSRTDGTLRMDQRFVFFHTRQTLPLHSVQQAVVGTNEGNTHMLFFVTDSGQNFGMDIGYMPRDGYYSSALAVNNFLAGNATVNGTYVKVPNMAEDPDWVKKSNAKFAEQVKEYKERLAQEKRKP